MTGGENYVKQLLVCVHEGLPLPSPSSDCIFVNGSYLYYHYGCDGFDDRGWGCGYRTLMSLCSWIKFQLSFDNSQKSLLPDIPTNQEIQKILVDIGDKESNFIASKQWIGTLEAAMVLDTLYETPCKIIHIGIGDKLSNHVTTIHDHFKSKGSPIMMGGGSDNSSKGIMGICRGVTQDYLLVVDPHFWGVATDEKMLHSKKWVTWRSVSDFESDFYNLCLPQLKSKTL